MAFCNISHMMQMLIYSKDAIEKGENYRKIHTFYTQQQKRTVSKALSHKNINYNFLLLPFFLFFFSRMLSMCIIMVDAVHVWLVVVRISQMSALFVATHFRFRLVSDLISKCNIWKLPSNMWMCGFVPKHFLKYWLMLNKFIYFFSFRSITNLNFEHFSTLLVAIHFWRDNGNESTILLWMIIIKQ